MTDAKAKAKTKTRFLGPIRKFLPVLVLLGVAMSAFSISHQPRETGPQKPKVYYSSLSDVSVLNIVNARTLWSATSKEATFSSDGGTANLKDIAINIPSENARLKASGGQYNLDTNLLSLTGEVKSEVKGFDVKTSSLQIVPGGKLNTGGDDKVLLTKKGIEIEGNGLEADQKRTVRLDKNVKAIFY